MQIKFIPLRSDNTLSLRRNGDSLTVNGVTYNFAQIAEGEILPAEATGCPLLHGNVTRTAGVLQISLILPYAPNSDANEDGEITDADVSEAIRFPEPIMVSGNGHIAAPGLSTFEGTPVDGVIDWTRLKSVAHQGQDRRAAWRETAAVSKLQLLLNLVTAEVISEESAMSPDIPSEFMPIIDTMPNPPRAEIRIRWAHLVDVPRTSPFVAVVQQAFGWSDEMVDGLFGWED